MTKLADLIDGMAVALQVSPSRVRTAAAQLRKHRLLRTGPRGPGAPEMSPQDATNLLLAIMYDGELADAHETVSRLRQAKLVRFQSLPLDHPSAEPLPPNGFVCSEEGTPFTLGEVLEIMLDWWVRHGTVSEGQHEGDDLEPMNIDLKVSCPGYRAELSFADPCCTPWRLGYEWKSPQQVTYESKPDAKYALRWDARNGPHIWSSRSVGEDCLYRVAECLRGSEWRNEWEEFTPSYDEASSAQTELVPA